MKAIPDRLDRWVRACIGLPDRLFSRRRPKPQARPSLPLAQVAQIIERCAAHPEAYLGLEDGLSYVCEGEGLLAWSELGDTAFGIGGLNVAEHGRPALIYGFVRETKRLGMAHQLLFPVRHHELSDVRGAGFHAIQVGVEAWLDLAGLTWQGPARAEVRRMIRRSARGGVRVEETAPEACADELTHIHHLWLASRRPSWRMKLLIGSPALDRPFGRRYLVARSASRIEAFCTLLPGSPGVWGLDVMCRRPDAVPGVIEAMIVHAAELLRAEGAQRFALGACPMAGIPTQGSHRALRSVFSLLFHAKLGNRVFGFKRLYRFKAKFQPRWEPVYFAASPQLGVRALYRGCRMWGLY